MKRRMRYPQVAPAHRKSRTKGQDPRLAGWLRFQNSSPAPQQFRGSGAPSEKSFRPPLRLQGLQGGMLSRYTALGCAINQSPPVVTAHLLLEEAVMTPSSSHDAGLLVFA